MQQQHKKQLNITQLGQDNNSNAIAKYYSAKLGNNGTATDTYYTTRPDGQKKHISSYIMGYDRTITAHNPHLGKYNSSSIVTTKF